MKKYTANNTERLHQKSQQIYISNPGHFISFKSKEHRVNKLQIYFKKLISMYERHAEKIKHNQLCIAKLSTKCLFYKDNCQKQEKKLLSSVAVISKEEFNDEIMRLKEQINKMHDLLGNINEEYQANKLAKQKIEQQQKQLIFSQQDKLFQINKEISLQQQILLNKRMILNNDERKMKQNLIEVQQKQEKQAKYIQIRKRIEQR